MHSSSAITGKEANRDERLLKRFVVRAGRQRRQTLRTQRRREGRREEWTEQMKLARMMGSYLDRRCTFWTSIENKPRSFVSGILQQKRGVKSGLPDVLVIAKRHRHGKPIFLELKSRRGLASRTQKEVHAELLPAGAVWWMARSARAAMTALYRSGVAFRRPWEPPQLAPWEGPFSDPHKRLPQEPTVAAQRREEQRRWNRRYRERMKAARMAAAEAA